MDDRRAAGTPITGGSSLLVIFAVLCLTIFALLALSTVQANGRLAQASAESVTAYYQADCRAEEVFALLRQGEVPHGVTLDHDICSYTCPISETQELQVEVTYTDTGWQVLRWQAVSTAPWPEEDRRLDLWDGRQ